MRSNSFINGDADIPRLLKSEDGMMTWATLIAVFCFCALIAMVFNVGRIANDKLEAQNAADSAAYSASLVQARAMNAITASNHIMGELTALYTLHHSMTDKKTRTSNAVVNGLNVGALAAYTSAYLAHFPTVLYGGKAPVKYGKFYSDIPRGKTTTYDAKCLLKWKAIEAYGMHLSSAFMWKVVVFVPVWTGKGVQTAANIQLTILKTEYEIIDKIETFTANTIPIKDSILPIMKAVYSYEKLVVLGTALQSERAAGLAAERNMCVGEVSGRPSLTGVAGVPTATLPVKVDSANNPERTQLMRATYPWVQHWRRPFVGFAYAALSNSRAAIFYEYHSDFFSKKFCKDFRDDRGYRLYVLEEMNGDRTSTDKGTESWRKRSGTEVADKLFCVVGFARQKLQPANTHLAFWPRTNPIPIATMAQAMQYNGLKPKLWTPGLYDNLSLVVRRRAQPVQGWDTLNWSEGATEWKNGKPYCGSLPEDIRWVTGRFTFLDLGYPPDLFPPAPAIKLSWRAKLVPVATSSENVVLPSNLEKRIGMLQDKDLKKRMLTQVIPATIAERTGFDFINH